MTAEHRPINGFHHHHHHHDYHHHQMVENGLSAKEMKATEGKNDASDRHGDTRTSQDAKLVRKQAIIMWPKRSWCGVKTVSE